MGSPMKEDRNWWMAMLIDLIRAEESEPKIDLWEVRDD